MRFVPQLSEEQVKFWVETENIDYVEIITLIANNEMSPKALNTEIFDNENWDPTEGQCKAACIRFARLYTIYIAGKQVISD